MCINEEVDTSLQELKITYIHENRKQDWGEDASLWYASQPKISINIFLTDTNRMIGKVFGDSMPKLAP